MHDFGDDSPTVPAVHTRVSACACLTAWTHKIGFSVVQNMSAHSLELGRNCAYITSYVLTLNTVTE